MKLGHGSEVKFLATQETVTYYMLSVEGEDTMRIACDAADPERVIHISTANGTYSLSTKGRFAMTAKPIEDADGSPLGMESRVDSKSVYAYVLPRLALLMARLLRAAS